MEKENVVYKYFSAFQNMKLEVQFGANNILKTCSFSPIMYLSMHFLSLFVNLIEYYSATSKVGMFFISNNMDETGAHVT